VEPKVLLLDEPFGALDAQVRKELRRWLRRLHDELHVTSIFVTHDQEEALEVADRVVLMNHGCIEQAGSPRTVWEHPATPFVARFLGGVPLVGDGTRPLRPHELEVHRLVPGEPVEGGVVATLRRALVLDPVVRLELESTSGGHELIEARLDTAQFDALGLREGDTVRVAPRARAEAAAATQA
jgi:sulfate transport system ATP-binding protein